MTDTSHTAEAGEGRRTAVAFALVAVILTLVISVSVGAALASGGDHRRDDNGPPRMTCAAACRVTYMRWVTSLPGHAGTTHP